MDRDRQFTNKIFRDGVSQGDRFLKELESDYITVEERDKKDLISSDFSRDVEKANWFASISGESTMGLWISGKVRMWI